MSYRSVKRLLGEQSLERKSHLIFGSFLLILIVGTFWWINSISERVIKDNMKQRAEEFASVVLMRIHYDEFGTVRDKEHEQAEKFAKEILPSDPPYAVLVSDEEKIQPDEQTFMYIKPNRADPGERLILYDLMLRLDERKSTQPLDNKPTLPKENVVDASELVTRQLSPVY